jgi:hypothetical protein
MLQQGLGAAWVTDGLELRPGLCGFCGVLSRVGNIEDSGDEERRREWGRVG